MHNSLFSGRHIGPSSSGFDQMLAVTEAGSLEELINQTIPADIRLSKNLNLSSATDEAGFFKAIRELGAANKLWRSYIGMGYYGTHLPAVIQRNILENPSWYTSYTPYQAEISQGRLEALLNFQTVVTDLTAMDIANASLLDEATAAAEAMIMMFNNRTKAAIARQADVLVVDECVLPQTIEVIIGRANPLNINVLVADTTNCELPDNAFGVVVQYPDCRGHIRDYRSLVETAHAQGAYVCAMADLLALTLVSPPGEWGADMVAGSSQRFGVPMNYGGPHAAFFAVRDTFKRAMPGRIIGVSKDADGKPALRMALQTREQHIKREKATSNICTAQALLANMAGMYAVWHGPEGLRQIALRVHTLAQILADKLKEMGYTLSHNNYFDTLHIGLPAGVSAEQLRQAALKKDINLFYPASDFVQLSIDETVTIGDLNDLISIFATAAGKPLAEARLTEARIGFEGGFLRASGYLAADVFHRYRSETEMMRYIKRLEKKDISLTQSMISLGSCTMKLNAAVELLPLSWPEFANLHPLAPAAQAQGYAALFAALERDLCEITGFQAVSLQPNSGAAGEYTGLLVIRKYLEDRGQGHRDLVLIPASAHGTNPASAVMAGYRVMVVNCDENGNIALDDLRRKAEENREKLAAFMVTYPSTHGVFENRIKEMCDIVHQAGGQVYMDGANMNAQVGLTNPATIGADVCHLNLHKTFAIPHGGGGPGVGPIAVAAHLAPYLPGHPFAPQRYEKAVKPVAAAPWGSAGILCISYGYIRMMGPDGLKHASEMAILNANYLAARLKDHYKVLYTNDKGRVAHELILDCRPLKALSGITETDIAKRLIDYGFHAPTLSFPVYGTLMIEPTESESKAELDRFVDALKAIHAEIMEVAEQKADKDDNVLRNAPHTLTMVTADVWPHAYTREKAAFPLAWLHENKYWPPVRRLDDAFGDRNLVCSCAAFDVVST